MSERPTTTVPASDIVSSSAATGADRPVISVIIPTYQRRSSVLRLIESLRGQSLRPTEFEVIVVVDGSTDGSYEALLGSSPDFALQVIRQENRGRAGACNAGIRIARAGMVLLLDDDMVAEPELLRAHLAAHRLSPRRGVLGAVPIAVRRGSPAVVRYYAEKFNAHLRQLETAEEIRHTSFYSGNFSIALEEIRGVGCFDERFRRYGNEDTELAVRLARAGVKLAYHPEAVARQTFDKGFGEVARDSIAKGHNAVLAARLTGDLPEDAPASKYRDLTSKWRHRSRAWRVMRAALLAVTRARPTLPETIAAFGAKFSNIWPVSTPRFLRFIFDYFYWVGVEQQVGGGEAEGEAQRGVVGTAGVSG
jgi:glycosyltransferase involved in cell wall biosynthesis